MNQINLFFIFKKQQIINNTGNTGARWSVAISINNALIFAIFKSLYLFYLLANCYQILNTKEKYTRNEEC